MVEVQMMTINVKLVLEPSQSLKSFIDKNIICFETFLSRSDGVQVSSDFDILFFDSNDVLSVRNLEDFINRIHEESLTVSEVNFLATMLMMSCEHYETDEVEDMIAELAELDELSDFQ